MARIKGVNISSVMNKQMLSIGNAQNAVLPALKRLAMSRGRGGTKVNGGHASAISARSRVAKGCQLFSVPYGEEGFSIFFYRSGNQDGLDTTPPLSGFAQSDEHASVWALYLGRFDDGKLVRPGHDNSPSFEAEEAL